MLYQNVLLHNFEVVVPVSGSGAVNLVRIPESVSRHLKETSQHQYRRAACSEIRFVNEGNDPATITLSTLNGPSKAYVYCGTFPCGQYLLGEKPQTLRLERLYPYLLHDERIQPESMSFDRNVWRVLLHGCQTVLHGVEGEGIRPPNPEEMPRKTLLSYGTSITFGESASVPDVTYMKQTGWRLGMDILNLGASGSAHCEPALADYIASRMDWDIATLCISINMLNQSVTAAEFGERASYMTCTIAKRNPQKPVIAIGLLPSFADFGLAWPDRHPTATSDEYRDTLRRIIETAGLPNLHYVDGRSLLRSPEGLSHDLLHPGDFGMIEIGERLASVIRSIAK